MEARPFSDISYEQFLDEDKLMGSKCNQCGAVFTPPRPICIQCHSSDMEWLEMQGRGKLAGFTCITVGPSFMIEEGYDRNNPYCVGVVELDEGTRVDARIEDVDASKPETIKVGMPLTVKFLHRGEGENLRTFLAFQPL
ncbi:transcriptional regulator [Desulfobacteraceae bacterium SEEP-SAG9]|nr:transcriptional regulator [Desulfobacteraceae bacterium SEEP-SAG9]